MLSAVSRLLPPPLTANWLNPLLCSWTIDPEVLQPLTPAGLELDYWQDSTYISLVGLRFESTRIFGLRSLVSNYHEVNLRFYVRQPAISGDPQPGVVFIRQFVPHRLTALAARALYGEPFETAPTGHEFHGSDSSGSALPACVAYHWDERGRRQRFWASADDVPAHALPGSLEEFLTRRYWGYNGKPGGRVRVYQLSRPDWQVRPASRWGIDCDFSQTFSGQLADAMRKAPASVLLATGSKATVGLPFTLPKTGQP